MAVAERMSTRRLTLAAACALACVALARLPWQRPEGGFAHLWLAQEATAAVLVAGLFTMARVQGTRIIVDGVARLALLWVLLDGVGGALATNPWAAVRAGTLTACGVGLFLLARTVGTSGRWAPVPLLLLVAGGVLGEAHGFLPRLSRYGHAPGGFLGERNLAAEVLVLGLPLLVAQVVEGRGAWVRRWAVVALTLSVAAIVLCRTRSAWLAGIALVLLGLFLVAQAARQRRASVRAAGVVVLAVVLGGAGAVMIPNPLRWTSRTPFVDTARTLVHPRTPSAHGRLIQYRTTLDMAAAHPVLGVGPGNWSGQYLAHATPDDRTLSAASWPVNRLPSSDLFGLLAERGLAGALLLLLSMVRLWRGVDDDRWLRRGTLVALIPVVVFDAVLQTAPGLLLSAWIFGAALPSPAPTETRHRVLPVVLPAAFVALLAAFALARVEGHRLLTHARGLDDLQAASRLDPGDVSRMLFVADIAVQSGRCDLALPLVDRAARRAAETRAGRALRRQCGRGEQATD